MKRLLEIQQKLKASKNQYNSYGGYNYRSCEDILEAVKPLLKEQGITLTLTDEIIQLDDRFYVKAKAAVYDLEGKEIHYVYGMAREPETRKGMDESQITGATSSYARKYALSGLLCIDDQKDPDATNKHGKDEEPKKDKPVCPICGKFTTQGALDAWSMCSECYKKSKTEKKQ